MRKLNYDIALGTVFKLPRMSWQVAEVAGEYKVEAKVERYGDTYYQCIHTTKFGFGKLLIEEICLAFLLGTEYSAEPLVIYSGKKYQPTNNDHFHFATEDGDNEREPFWYCGHLGEHRTVSCDMYTGEWCFYSLPWDNRWTTYD